LKNGSAKRKKKMPSYQDLHAALEILDLPERARLDEIRSRHRQLVRRHHPDAGGGDDETIRRINAAYRLLSDYCRAYRFDFSHAEFLEQCPEERLREQFAGDPLWKGGDEG